MKVKLAGADIGLKFDIDANAIIKKVEEMAAAEYVNITADLDLKTISDQKLRWLRQSDRNFFKMNKNLEELLMSFITMEDTFENQELVATAEKELKDYLIQRFENPDVKVKPLKPSTLKLKRRKGYPLKPGVASQDLLNDIKQAKMELKVSFGSGGRKRVKTP